MAKDITEWRRDEFLISTDRARLDLDVIHGFLTKSYWAKGISRELVARSLEHSLCFGIYDESGSEGPDFANAVRPGASQVGFCRVVSDLTTVAYLGDVFVLETYRGRGLSKFLMECVTQHPALDGLRRWILLTRDAHDLYKKFGFTPLKSADRYMELHRPDVYEIRKTS
jgi:ribosomal protein S18 acetylase RimI-like enzyme